MRLAAEQSYERADGLVVVLHSTALSSESCVWRGHGRHKAGRNPRRVWTAIQSNASFRVVPSRASDWSLLSSRPHSVPQNLETSIVPLPRSGDAMSFSIALPRLHSPLDPPPRPVSPSLAFSGLTSLARSQPTPCSCSCTCSPHVSSARSWSPLLQSPGEPTRQPDKMMPDANTLRRVKTVAAFRVFPALRGRRAARAGATAVNTSPPLPTPGTKTANSINNRLQAGRKGGHCPLPAPVAPLPLAQAPRFFARAALVPASDLARFCLFGSPSLFRACFPV